MGSYASTILADSPLAFWPLSGATMVDASGNGHGGVVGTGVTVEQASIMPGDVAGSMKIAASQNTVQCLSVPHAAALETTTAQSLEIWFNAVALPAGDNQLFCNGNDSIQAPFEITVNGASLTATIKTSAIYATTAYTLTTATRYHIVATYDGAHLLLYLNGTQIESVAATGSLITDSNGPTIGSGYGDGSASVSGYVQNAAIYGVALSAMQVMTHYTAGTTAQSVTNIYQAKASAVTAKPKFLVSRLLKATSTVTAKPLPIARATVKATSAASARFAPIARTLRLATSTATAVLKPIVTTIRNAASSAITASGSDSIAGGTVTTMTFAATATVSASARGFFATARTAATSLATAKPTLRAIFTAARSSIVSALGAAASSNAAPTTYGLASAVTTGAPSVTVTLGRAPAVGDVLTVVVGAYDPTAISITPPSGWTLVQHVTSGSGFSESAYFQHTATSADVSTYAYTFGLASSSSAARVAIFGVTGTVDAAKSSIVGTVAPGSAPLQGSGTAETAGTNELLVVFATSTRASQGTAAPTISPSLTSLGSIPFATDASLTPTVAGWSSSSSFTTPTATIDPSNNFNASLIGVMTMGFMGSSTVTTMTFTASTAAIGAVRGFVSGRWAGISLGTARLGALASAAGRATSSATAFYRVLASPMWRATSVAAGIFTGRASLRVISSSSATPGLRVTIYGSWSTISAIAARSSPVATILVRATSAALATVGRATLAKNAATSTVSSSSRFLVTIRAARASIVSAIGQAYATSGNFYRTFTATSGVSAGGSMRVAIVTRATATASAIARPITAIAQRATAFASSRTGVVAASRNSGNVGVTGRIIGVTRLRSIAISTVSAAGAAIATAGITFRTFTASTAVGARATFLGSTRNVASTLSSARVVLRAATRSLGLSQAIGTVRFVANVRAGATSAILAAGAAVATAGVTLRTFTASTAVSARSAFATSARFTAASNAVARVTTIMRARFGASVAVVGASRVVVGIVSRATAAVSARAVAVVARTFTATVATSARTGLRVGLYATAASALVAASRGRIAAVWRGTIGVAGKIATITGIFGRATSAIVAAGRALFTGKTIVVALPNGDGETIAAPLIVAATISTPLELGLTLAAALEATPPADTIVAPLRSSATITAPLEIALTIRA